METNKDRVVKQGKISNLLIIDVLFVEGLGYIGKLEVRWKGEYTINQRIVNLIT